VLPKILSLISIVLVLGWMFYFLVGGLPLLILKHGDPHDWRLVRGFFDVHYIALMCIAAFGTLSAAFSGRWLLAVAFAVITLVGFTARRVIVSHMDHLRDPLSAADDSAISQFRRLHVTGIGLGVALLAGFISALAFSSADMVTCVQVPPGCQGDACKVQCSLL
jgi:hypothetical protein